MSQLLSRGRIVAASFVVLAPTVSLLPLAQQASAASCQRPSGISGVVATERGDALPGSQVSIYANPNLAGLKVGQSVTMPMVGTSVTDSRGCFAIAKPNGNALARIADRTGGVELTYFVQRPGGVELRNVPITIARQTSQRATADVASRYTSFEAFGGGRTTARSIDAPRASTENPNDVATGMPNSTFHNGMKMPAGQRINDSRWTLLQNYGNRKTIVGQWYSKTSGVKQTWYYGKGAESTLGAAFSLSGAAGSYKHSEENTESTSGQVTFPTVTGKAGKYFQSFFRYGRYKLEYYDWHRGWYTAGYFVKRTTWERGARVFSKARVPEITDKSNRCVPYVRGATDSTETSTAITWTDGVGLSGSMKGILGAITLSSKTGFSTTARNQVEFTKKGRLCGVYGRLSQPGALAALPAK